MLKNRETRQVWNSAEVMRSTQCRIMTSHENRIRPPGNQAGLKHNIDDNIHIVSLDKLWIHAYSLFPNFLSEPENATVEANQHQW